MIQAAENEVAEMAREAARADAMARAARKAEMGEGQQLELQRLKVGFSPVFGLLGLSFLLQGRNVAGRRWAERSGWSCSV